MVQSMVCRNDAPWDSDALQSFDMSDGDILILDSPGGDRFAGLASAARLGHYRTPMTFARASVHVRRALASIQLDDSSLADDMVATFRSFLKQYRLNEANLLIECTDRRNCPMFHCDNLHVRMIKTYFGPTTEYIQLTAPGEIHAAPVGAMVFLKGRRHSTHHESVHHRSPDIAAGTTRLCLIVDF